MQSFLAWCPLQNENAIQADCSTIRRGCLLWRRLGPGLTASGTEYERKAISRSVRACVGRVGLDVFEDEPAMKPGLAECENAVIVPHIASASLWTRSGMVRGLAC